MIHKVNKPFILVYKISGDNSIVDKGIYFETFGTVQELDDKVKDLFFKESNNFLCKTVIMFQNPDNETLDKIYH
jgi:hypothetical protein